MTEASRGSRDSMFRRAAVALFVCLLNAPAEGNNFRNDVQSQYSVRYTQKNRCKQARLTSFCIADGYIRSQNRPPNPFLYSNFYGSATTPILLRGGSTTIQKRKVTPSIDTNREGEIEVVDTSKNEEIIIPSSNPPPSSALSMAWSRRDLTVFLSSCFFMVLSASLVSFSPAPALIAEIGLDRATSTLSVIAACAALTEIIFSPALGSLLDSIGIKPALILAISCAAFMNGLVSMHSSVLTICAAKFTSMLCFASFTIASQVILSDISVSNPERMSSTLGIIAALSGCGFITGAIGAGRLSEFGLSVTYGTSAVVGALTAILVVVGMQETLLSSKRIPFRENKARLRKQLLQSPWSSCTRILFRHSKEVRRLAILIMIQSFPIHMNDTFQILVRSEWNINMKDFSSFFAMFGIISIFSNIVGSKLVVKLGIKYFTAIATLSSVLAPIGASLFSYRGLLLGNIIGFLGSSQMLGVTAALYMAGANSNVSQGELAGERSSFLALAKVIGPVWYSFLFVKGKKVFGTGFLPFWFNVGCGLAAFGISQRYLPS